MGYNNTGAFTAGQCVVPLIDLLDVQNEHSPLLRRSPVGYIEALTSDMNRQGEEIPISSGDKLHSARIKYLQRAVESQVVDTISRDCEVGTFDDYNEVDFSITKEVEEKWSLSEADFRRICEGQGAFVEKLFASKFDAIARKINKAILTEQAANMGKNITTGLTTATTVNVFPDATGNLNARPIQKIKFDYEFSNQSIGTPMIVFGGLFKQYHDTLKVGCCNDAGIDMLGLANSLGYAPFADVTLESVFGANRFLVLEPTKVKFVGYNEYVGESVKRWDDTVHDTIVDKRTNIKYDLKIVYDNCSEKWTFALRKFYDIWFEPSDAWQVQDPLYGTNGSLLYLAATT